MSYKIGDKFIVEIGEIYHSDRIDGKDRLTDLYRMRGFRSLVFDGSGLNNLEKYEENPCTQEDCDKARQEGYEEGLKDARDAAMKIVLEEVNGGLSSEELEEIFKTRSLPVIFANYFASEAISKIKVYEGQKKAEGEDVTTFEKKGEYVREGVRYFTFNCKKCGRLVHYRFLEDGKYANFCDQCGNKIVNMPFFDSEYKINDVDKEIKVGDEIEYKLFDDVVKAVVLQVVNMGDGGYKVLCENGCGQVIYKTGQPITKTGKHYDIEGLLKAMRED